MNISPKYTLGHPHDLARKYQHRKTSFDLKKVFFMVLRTSCPHILMYSWDPNSSTFCVKIFTVARIHSYLPITKISIQSSKGRSWNRMLLRPSLVKVVSQKAVCEMSIKKTNDPIFFERTYVRIHKTLLSTRYLQLGKIWRPSIE